MTLRAYLITLRGRIREALVPELQELRDRHAHEFALNGRLSMRAIQAETRAKEWKAIAATQFYDARRGRWLLDKMQHQQCGPNEGWTLDELYPGDDAAAAIDAAMDQERGDE